MKLTKVALDANIPQRAVRMLQTGYGDQGFEFLWEPDFAAASAADEFWAVAFKRFGGHLVITGDKNIAKRPHQIVAFMDNDLICYFCNSRWAHGKLIDKVTHVLYWWPRIQAHYAGCRPRDCWWLPMGVRPAEFKKVEVPESVQEAARANRKPA